MTIKPGTQGARRRQNLVELFHEFSDIDSEFLKYDDGLRTWSHTYSAVGLAARHFAKRLQAEGIRKGDKVLIWSENRPEWVVAFWGCLLSGVIVVPIDYRDSRNFIDHVQEIVLARLVLIGDDVVWKVSKQGPPFWQLSEIVWEDDACEEPPVHIDESDIAEIVFTSGATGHPKGVLITHKNILANLDSLEVIIGQYRKWLQPVIRLRMLNLIPLSHMFGQALTLFILPCVLGVVVFMRGYSAHEIVRQTKIRRIALVVAVPKILEVLRKHVLQLHPDAANQRSESRFLIRMWRHRCVHRLFGWRLVVFVVGAASLSKDLEDFWSELGFLVVQGYGLTETAPIVAFNNPLEIGKGTVGKPASGFEIRIASDGEILLRGPSVTPGYYQSPAETESAFQGGWFHTGDLGSLDTEGRLAIRGRKKELIVTPEGMKVFPEDVEAVLNRISAVRESAVVGRDRVHAVLVLENGVDPNEIIREANTELEEHQKIRNVSIWPEEQLPRTDSTRKLKRGEIQAWVESGGHAPIVMDRGSIADVLKEYAGDREIRSGTTLDELGLSSLDRVELLLDLEKKLDMSIDESKLTSNLTVSALAGLGAPEQSRKFPVWSRSWPARIIRNCALTTIWLPATRLFAQAHVSGREHLDGLRGPIIFAPNHQSHLDTPLLVSMLPMRYRYRFAAAMWQEFFDGYFFPERHTRFERFRDTIGYYLVALFFNAFPIPQTEAGARQSLRYLGEMVSDNWSILFFPEGERTEAGEIKTFQPGIGLIAGQLKVPVVPVRLRGLDRVLHRHARWPRIGRVEVSFGKPLCLRGNDYDALAKRIEEAVRAM
jgi:long-chain acyl-CoA synthetase